MCAYQLHSRNGELIEVGWQADTESYFARAYPAPGAEPTDLLPDRTGDTKITDPAELCEALQGRVDVPIEVVDALLQDRAATLMQPLTADLADTSTSVDESPSSGPDDALSRPDLPPHGVVIDGHSPGFLDSL